MKIPSVQNNYALNKNSKKSFKNKISQAAIRDIKRQYAKSPHLPKYLESINSYNAFMNGLEKVSFQQLIEQLYNKYGIMSDLKGNKVLAGINALACNIFQKLGLIKPPALLIRDFKFVPEYKNALAVTVTQFGKSSFNNAFNEAYPFRTVIYNSNIDWDNIQQLMIANKETGHLSSGHFLGVAIHEYFHNAHAHNIFSRYKNISVGNDVFSIMQKKTFNKNNIDLLKKETSKYATTNPLEAITEEITERIIDSLHPKTLLPKYNPLISRPQDGPAALNKLIDDIWSGNWQRNY